MRDRKWTRHSAKVKVRIGYSAKLFKMAAQFRSNLWDPVLIVSQIIAIQCTYYVGLGVWILIFDFWMGSVHSLHQIFSDKVRNVYLPSHILLAGKRF